MAFTTIGKQVLMSLAMGETTYNAFDNSHAYLGVGDSSTAFSAAHTDLQAASNKLRKGMEASYPQRSSAVLTFKASFGSSEANFAWNEWAIFNASASGQMLNRKAESLGTKASGSTWVLTATIEP